jgi:Tfp pilus assembly protein PilN
MKAVNLLPPDTRGAAKAPAEHAAVVTTDDTSSFGAFAVLGGLVLAVLAVAGLVLAGNAIKDREAKLASVKAQQQQIAGRAAKLKTYADFDQLASERVSTVRDLAGDRFDWEQVLRDLSRALPADVTLQSIEGNVSTDAGGAGGSSLRGAISAPAITLTGCMPSQHGVARLMARLRNVDGVTRVSLSKSEKTDTGEGSSAGAGSAVPATGATDTMAARLAAPCGEGSHPDFELVIFFEGEKDVADAPSASPAAPGTAGAPAQGSASPTPTASASATPAAGGSAATTSTTSTTTSTSAQPQATPTTQGGVAP